MADVVDHELAELTANPNAGIIGSELDGVECTERGEAGHELKESML